MKKYIFLLPVIFLFYSCGYNTIIANEEAVNAAWGNVQAQYQRRLELIPGLVKVVQAYAKHEKDTLTAVIEARSKATSIQMTPEMLNDPEALNKFQKMQGEISSAISRLLVLTENYPNLKADQNFRDLQAQLEGTENRIAVARQRYNEAVQTFNTSIRTFPNVITNMIFLRLKPKTPFTASEGADRAPEIKFE